MSSSGAFTTFTIAEILEEAYERAGLEMRTGYDLKTGLRSMNFLLAEWANKGLNLWTLEAVTLPVLVGTASYTLDPTTIDIVDHAVRTPDGIDYVVERISTTMYSHMTNKTMVGRPLQIVVERKVDAPTITLWPVPDQAYTLVYWRLRRIQDAGGVANTADLPFRFIPAFVAGCAYHIGMKKATDPNRVMMLKAGYDEAFQLAADEDRDRTSLFFAPEMT